MIVSAASGYTVPTGQTFSLLTFGSYSGSFSSINNTTGTSMTPQYNSGDFNMLSLADSPPPADDVPVQQPPVEQERAVVRARAEEGDWLLATAEEVPQNDLVFVTLAEEGEDGPGVGVSEDAVAWEDILTLPLRLPLALAEDLAAAVG
jgi:hypothetical protein